MYAYIISSCTIICINSIIPSISNKIHLSKLDKKSFVLFSNYMNSENLLGQLVNNLSYDVYDHSSKQYWNSYTGSKMLVEDAIRGASALLDKIIDKIAYDFCLHDKSVQLLNIQINYYRNDDEWLHEHSHGHSTLLLSIGKSRILTIENQQILLNNGDLTIFHHQKHGVPILAGNAKKEIETINKENNFKGRMSIAFFLHIRE